MAIIIRRIQVRKRWEVASGEYDNVRLDHSFVDTLRFWTAVKGEVSYAILGDVRRIWRDINCA
jgi:hypothetical protein